MAQQQSQPEAVAEGAAEAPAEGEDTSVAGTEPEAGAPAGDAGAAETEKPAEEQKPEPTEEEKAAAEAKEAELKTAAEKYAKDLVTQANRTMAAARRAQKEAEKAAAPLRAELQTAQHEAKVYSDFVKELQTTPMTALSRLGFKTFRDFAAFVVEQGGDAKPQTEEERIDALVAKKLEEREAPRKAEQRAAEIANAKKVVFAHVDAQTERYDLVTTDIGHDRLWKKIEAYHKAHGTVPDEAIALLADKAEQELAAELAKSKRFGSQPAKNGTTAPGAAAPGASTSGKPLAGKPTSSAPAPRKYSLDDDERTAQINAELRAEGLL